MLPQDIEEFIATLNDQNQDPIRNELLKLLQNIQGKCVEWMKLKDQIKQFQMSMKKNNDIIRKIEKELTDIRNLNGPTNIIRRQSNENESAEGAAGMDKDLRSGLRKTGLIGDDGSIQKDDAEKMLSASMEEQIKYLQSEIDAIKAENRAFLKDLEKVLEKSGKLEIYIEDRLAEVESVQYVLKLSVEKSQELNDLLDLIRAHLDLSAESENQKNGSFTRSNLFLNAKQKYKKPSEFDTFVKEAMQKLTQEQKKKPRSASNDNSARPPKPSLIIKPRNYQTVPTPTKSQNSPIPGPQKETSAADDSSTLDGVQLAYQITNNFLEQDIEKLKSELLALRAENEKLVKDSQNVIEGSRTIRHIHDSLQRDYYRVLEENKYLKEGKAKAAKQDPETSAKNAELIETLMNANKNLNNELDAMKKLNPDMYNVKDILDENELLQQEIEAIRGAVDGLDKCRAELDMCERTLEKELSDKAKRKADYELVLARKNYYKNELKKQIDINKADNNRSAQLNKRLETEIKQLKEERTDLKALLKKETDKHYELDEPPYLISGRHINATRFLNQITGPPRFRDQDQPTVRTPTSANISNQPTGRAPTPTPTPISRSRVHFPSPAESSATINKK